MSCVPLSVSRFIVIAGIVMLDKSIRCRCAGPRCGCLCMLFFRDRRTHTCMGSCFSRGCPSLFDSFGLMCTVLSMGPSLLPATFLIFTSTVSLTPAVLRLVVVVYLVEVSLSSDERPPHSSPLTTPQRFLASTPQTFVSYFAMQSMRSSFVFSSLIIQPCTLKNKMQC